MAQARGHDARGVRGQTQETRSVGSELPLSSGCQLPPPRPSGCRTHMEKEGGGESSLLALGSTQKSSSFFFKDC